MQLIINQYINKKRYISLLIVFYILIFNSLYFSFAGDNNYPVKDIGQQWEFKLGDYQINHIEEVTGWENINEYNGLHGMDYIWLRIKLPNVEYDDPSLFCRPEMISFEVYYDNKIIYEKGDMKQNKRFPGSYKTLVKIPSKDYANKYLYFRIKPDFKYSDFPIVRGFITTKFGSQFGIFQSINNSYSVSELFLGFSYIFIGISAILVAAVIKKEIKTLFTFGVLAIASGALTVSGHYLRFSFKNISEEWLYNLVYYALYIFPVAVCSFLEDLVQFPLFKRINNIIWKAALTHYILIIALSALKIVPICLSEYVFYIVFAIVLVYVMISLLIDSKKGNDEAKTIFGALVIACVVTIADLIRHMQPSFSNDSYIYHWGVLVFFLAIEYVLIKRFMKAHSDLNDLNINLEKKVKIRTEEFENANQELTVLNKQMKTINTELTETVNKLQETRNQLIESEKLASLGHLIGGIAHNLKTPLMSCSGGINIVGKQASIISETIQDTTLDDTKQRPINEAIDKLHLWEGRIRDYLIYMNDIINTVKSQAVPPREGEGYFSIHDLLNRVTILMSNTLKAHGCTINYNIKVPQDKHYQGEINYLIQVIDNLIDNAVESYERKGGNVIDFNVMEENNQLVISVRDYGVGIKEEVKEKLFKQFTTTKGKDGTGLGLFISKSIISGKFNGDLSFISHCDQGTEFYIKIPLG